jgi:hypothetical protein
MTLDDAVAGLFELQPHLPIVLEARWHAVEPDVNALYDRLRDARSKREREDLVDALLELLREFQQLERPLSIIESRREPDAVSWGPKESSRRGGYFGRSELELSIRPAPETAGAEPADGGAPATVERTPHLDVDAPGPIAPGTRFKASVYLSGDPLREGEEGAGIVLPDLPELQLRVWLIASEHFTIDGEDTAVITVRSGEERSTTAEFRLECTSAAPGRAGITATFAYDLRPAGSVWRELSVAGADGGAAAAAHVPAAAVRVDTVAREADLVIRILQDPDGDDRHFALTFSSPLVDEYAAGRTVPWRLRQGTKDFVAGFMDAFTSADPGGRKAALVGAGKQLFRATPEELQTAFWRIAESGSRPLETIFVVSSEPYIPWELMIPNDGPKSRPPLGVEFSVGRWVHPQHIAPVQRMPIVDSYVIAPSYSGSRALAFSAAEAQYVVDAFAGQRITPAFIRTIEAALGSRGATLLHLICHGTDAAGGQVLELDPDERLLEVQLEGLDGVMKAVAEKQPFVFINACEVGRTTPALVGTGGFAAAFTRLGARCVIAPIWSVKDSVASVVARSFYDEIRADPQKPFARVLRDIRKRAYEGDDPEDSYAAYCFYGDPLAAQA